MFCLVTGYLAFSSNVESSVLSSHGNNNMEIIMVKINGIQRNRTVVRYICAQIMNLEKACNLKFHNIV